MTKVSHREYLLWLSYFEVQTENPTTDQWYLAQIAQEVRRVLSKNKKSIKLKQFLLKFTKGKEQPKQPVDPQEATKVVRSRWFGRLGMKGSKDYG